MDDRPPLAEPDTTDEHFLHHVVESARAVQASEDIVTASGMKLLAKGAKVDRDTRDRLLAHKLAKPLEQCLEVADAIGTETLDRLGQELFDKQPLLRALHGDSGSADAVHALSRLTLTPPLRSR